MGFKRFIKKVGKHFRNVRDLAIKAAPVLAPLAVVFPPLAPLAYAGKIVGTVNAIEKSTRTVHQPPPLQQQVQLQAVQPEGYIAATPKNQYLQLIVYAIVNDEREVAENLWTNRHLANLTIDEEHELRTLAKTKENQ